MSIIFSIVLLLTLSLSIVATTLLNKLISGLKKSPEAVQQINGRRIIIIIMNYFNAIILGIFMLLCAIVGFLLLLENFILGLIFIGLSVGSGYMFSGLITSFQLFGTTINNGKKEFGTDDLSKLRWIRNAYIESIIFNVLLVCLCFTLIRTSLSEDSQNDAVLTSSS